MFFFLVIGVFIIEESESAQHPDGRERNTHLEPQQHRNPVDRDWDWIGEMEAS